METELVNQAVNLAPLAKALAISLPAVGAALGIGMIGSKAMESIGHNALAAGRALAAGIGGIG
jgi:F0F1-type ATP synthase membrane subunit c/vacuolar-type H+-ATPase subunit K